MAIIGVNLSCEREPARKGIAFDRTGIIVPCAIDRTEMVAAFPGEVLEVIQISSVFNAEKNVLTSIFFNFYFVCFLLSIKSKIKITL